MRVEFHPSFLRGALSILSWLVALTAVTYLWDGYHEHHWWARGYLLSLLVPFVIMPTFVCFMAVPSKLALTETHLTFQFLWRRVHTIAWDDLEYHGWGEGIYSLQFCSARTFDILPQALPRHEWKMLKNFLSTTFPDRRASGFIGARLFKCPWKKKKSSPSPTSDSGSSPRSQSATDL